MNQPIRPLAIGRPLLSPVKNNTGLYSDLGTPDEFLVAEVQGGQNPDSELGMYVRLFLAAPDMYELLKSIDHALHLDLMNFDATDHRQVYDYAKIIRVLLTKIEGGGE